MHPAGTPPKPKPLRAKDLRKVRTAEFRQQQPHVQRLIEERRARHLEKFASVDERTKRLMWRYALGWMVAFPVLMWLVTPIGGDVFWLQMLVGAAYGLYVARWGGSDYGIVLLLCAVGTLWIAGKGTFLFGFGAIMVTGACVAAGNLMAIHHRLRRVDGG